MQAKLVEDLLDISRITAGKISLNLELVQLQGVIKTAIARSLVQLHGGTIFAQRAGVGHGTTFIVTLPLIYSDRQYC